MNAEVEVLLDPETALRTRTAYWTPDGRHIVDADGSAGLDPNGPTAETARAHFSERRQRLGRDRADTFEPLVELRFRLAAAPEVGEFMLSTSLWDFPWDNSASGAAEALAAHVGRGPILATLKIEPVSFVAKNGPMKGQEVNYNKPVLTLRGPVASS